MTRQEPEESEAAAVRGVSPDFEPILAATLNQAHMTEQLMRTVLVRAIGKSNWALEQVDELLLRVDYGRKVAMLEKWMTATGDSPQPLIGQLRALQALRNRLAHGLPIQHDDPGVIRLAGRFSVHGVRTERIDVAESYATLDGAQRAVEQLLPMTVSEEPWASTEPQ